MAVGGDRRLCASALRLSLGGCAALLALLALWTPATTEAAAPVPYETKWYNQTLDHFNFQTKPLRYQQRYLWNSDYWNRTLANGCRGPIFFYTGNEGDITSFWNNTGFVTQVLAPHFGALLVFAEHRYYGQSMPFGNKSLARENVGYLTSEQALADYAELITYLQATVAGFDGCPIVAVGGSYGGMLTAWFRLKYPNLVVGGLAASAPIGYFYDTGVSEFGFAQIATQDYTDYSDKCSAQVRAALLQIVDAAGNQTALKSLAQQLRLCAPFNSTEIPGVIDWLSAALTYMAMTDYPYAADFLEPMPAWPVTVACERLLSDPQQPLVAALADAVGVYYNYTGQAGACYKLYEPSPLGTQGWYYQECTEMVMPLSYNGVTDMFPPKKYNLTLVNELCTAAWAVHPRPAWITTFDGGFNITAGSNIIFSNGQLDPWRAGGVQQSLSNTLVAIVIDKAAHHLDLRGPNPADPESVIIARELEAAIIRGWIEEFAQAHSA